MGTLQEALQNPTTVAGNQRTRTAPPAALPAKPKRTGVEILRDLRENRNRQQASQLTARQNEETAAQQEAATEEVTARLEADAQFTIELSELNRNRNRHPRGSVQAEETRLTIEQLTDDQRIIRTELEEVRKTNPSAYDEGKRRYNFRQEALETAESVRALIGSASASDIKGRITAALEAGLIAVTTDEHASEFSFDRAHYVSPWPNDPTVSSVASSFSELIADLQSRSAERDNAVTAELMRGGFWISAHRGPDATRPGEYLDSELDLFRKVEQPVRKVSEFLDGNGRYYVVRVGRGSVILENRGGKFLAVKTSDVRAGRALFTVPERESGGRIARKSPPEINNSGTTVSATDVSGVWYDPLQEALQGDLRREAESDGRRETANGLRNINGIDKPLTFYVLGQGGIGTVPVSVSYEDPENGRRHTVTFQVEGDGSSFQVTATVPGTEGVIKRVKRDRSTRKVVSSKAFLPDFIGKKTPLNVLGQDPLWKLVQVLNKPFERDWQLAREGSAQNAMLVSADNLDGLISSDSGADGLFAVPATIRNNVAEPGKTREFVYKPVGYIFERKGSKVRIVWAVPGTSEAYAKDILGEHEISNLPFRMKVILGSAEWNLHRRNSEHLQLSKKSSEGTTATE